MSKKLLCLFLCLVMFVFPILTSCGQEETEVESADAAEATRKPMTLSLWLPTDKSTSKTAVNQVESALNVLLAGKYETNIELNLVSEDEYEEKIDAQIKKVQKTREDAEKAARKAHLQLIKDVKDCLLPSERKSTVTDTGKKESNEAYTIIDEHGQKVTVYPEVADDQLDIFLVKGYDKYLDYIENELIVSIDEEMSSVGGSLYNYIYPTFFDLARVEGSLYCVPNNHALDDYEYLLVNKELADYYSYSGDELTDIIKCEDFIMDVYNRLNAADKSDEEKAILENVTPLLGTCEAPNMIYFGAPNESKEDHTAWSYDKFSIIATSIGPGVTFNSVDTKFMLASDAGVGDVTYGKLYALMRRFQSVDGIVGDGIIDEGEKFAVGVIEGGADLQAEYGEDYYMNIHAVPLADTDDVFGSEDEDGAVFCVSSFTKDAARAVEVITFLNTNEEFRTILQYGIKEVHWTTKKDANGEEVLKVLSNDYTMDLVNTGNMYLTYPGADMPKSYWEYAKQQNRESSCNPFIGFTFDSWYDSKTPDSISQSNLIMLQKKSAEYLTMIEQAQYDINSTENDSVDRVIYNIRRGFNSAIKDQVTIADRKQNITVGCLYDFAFSPMDKLKEEYLEGDKPKINDTIVGAYDMYAMTKN